MPVFARYTFDDCGNPVDDSAAAAGEQGGLYLNGARPAGGEVRLDGRNDLVKIFADDAFQLDRGTIDLSFTPADQDCDDAATVLSRDTAGQTAGGFRIDLAPGGIINVVHETAGGQVAWCTPGGFVRPCDRIEVSYSWDVATGGRLVITNATTGAAFETATPAGLTMDQGDGDGQPWLIGAGQGQPAQFARGDALGQFYEGSVGFFSVSDTVDNIVAPPPPPPVRDGLVTGTAGNDLIDTAYRGDPDGDRIDAGDAIIPGDTPDADRVFALDGNDTVRAGKADDTVFGGDGNDRLFGDSGDDALNGDAGHDTLFGGEGGDSLAGGAGDDRLEGDNGDDTLQGDDGNDRLEGENGDDALSGGEGDDLLDGGRGDDRAEGGQGSDTIAGGQGNDTILGGAGADMLLGNEGDDLILAGDAPDASARQAEQAGAVASRDATAQADADAQRGDTADGGAGNDTIIGTSENDSLSGGTGNDRIEGRGGQDTIDGNDGADSLLGEDGDDLVEGGSGADTIFGGSGQDALFGEDDADTVSGDGGDDDIFGGGGKDVLSGGDGQDSIVGGVDGDTITGGKGDDTLFGGDDRDVFSYIAGDGRDTVFGGAGGDDFDRLDLSTLGPRGFRLSEVRPDSDGNGFDGKIEILDGNGAAVGAIQFENIERIVPCFTTGTMIATPRGEVPVESLQAGDRVITRDNGIQEIVWAGHRTLSWAELQTAHHLKPVLVRRGSLGNGLPERDLLVSPNHRLLVANDRTALYFDEHEVLVAAKHLIGARGVQHVDAAGVTYIHFMCATHQVVLSDGAWTESFQPGDQTLKGMGNAQRNEIFELFPVLKSPQGIADYAAARRTLKRHEARLLMR